MTSKMAQGGAWLAACLASGAGMAFASDAGMPDCAGVAGVRVVHEGLGAMESAAFLPSGKLVFSQPFRSKLMRKDSLTAQPVEVASGISMPGGIVVNSETEVVIGTGNGAGGVVPSLGLAGLARVDLVQGQVTPVVKGLSMANGVVRAPDGSYYASDNLALSLDRVSPSGVVQRKWLNLNSNGLALSRDGRTLFVNQFMPAAIKAVNLADGAVTLHAAVPLQRALAGLDGLDIDAQGNLYVAAYLSGEIWRASPGGQLCRLAQGLSLPSAVVVGKPGQGFAPDSVYVLSYSGRMYEIAGAVPVAP